MNDAIPSLLYFPGQTKLIPIIMSTPSSVVVLAPKVINRVFGAIDYVLVWMD